MPAVIFWGATGQAKVLREALSDTNLELVALFDQREISSPFGDVPLHAGENGFDAWCTAYGDISNVYFCVAIGGNRGYDRIAVHERLCAAGLMPLIVIHRTAFIANDASLNEGCQILPQASVGTQVQLGRCVIINTAASVDHDCKLDDGVHIGPGAVLAGEVRVSRYAFIGAGAVVLPHLSIGESAIVGAGAVATKNVPPGVAVIGNPARLHIR